jgi:hypothetical protein
LRIPVDADRDSAVMPTGIPERCRPAFRWQADRHSAGKPTGVPEYADRLFDVVAR